MVIPLSVFGIILTVFFGQAVLGVQLIQRPFSRAASSISNWAFWSNTSDRITAKELEQLYKIRDSLAIDKAEYESFIERINQLEALLAFSERTTNTTITTSIISRALDGSNRFTIDAGKRSGVAQGQAVIVGDGILIGKVSEVSEYTSTVTALQHRESAVATSLLNETHTIGIVEGGTGNLLTMSFIPDSEQISPNDLVVTSGLEDGIPSGLVVGIVNVVMADKDSPFQEAIVEPMTDPRRHHVVFVVMRDSL
jgi:rod shape-determining protein MreC